MKLWKFYLVDNAHWRTIALSQQASLPIPSRNSYWSRISYCFGFHINCKTNTKKALTLHDQFIMWCHQEASSSISSSSIFLFLASFPFHFFFFVFLRRKIIFFLTFIVRQSTRYTMFLSSIFFLSFQLIPSFSDVVNCVTRKELRNERRQRQNFIELTLKSLSESKTAFNELMGNRKCQEIM